MLEIISVKIRNYFCQEKLNAIPLGVNAYSDLTSWKYILLLFLPCYHLCAAICGRDPLRKFKSKNVFPLAIDTYSSHYRQSLWAKAHLVIQLKIIISIFVYSHLHDLFLSAVAVGGPWRHTAERRDFFQWLVIGEVIRPRFVFYRAGNGAKNVVSRRYWGQNTKLTGAHHPLTQHLLQFINAIPNIVYSNLPTNFIRAESRCPEFRKTENPKLWIQTQTDICRSDEGFQLQIKYFSLQPELVRRSCARRLTSYVRLAEPPL